MAGYSNGLSAGGVKNGNGKRERVDQEDDQEFMPLSKRINNIHLSPERLVNGGSSASYMHTNGVSAHPPVHQSLPNGYGGVGVPQRQFNNGYDDHHQPNGFRVGPGGDTIEFAHSRTDGRGPLHSSGSSEQSINFHNLAASEVPVLPIHSSDLVTTNEFSNYQYRPSLSQTANPHYYEANRTLFELYIERQLRNHQIPHSNIFGTPSASSVN